MQEKYRRTIPAALIAIVDRHTVCRFGERGGWPPILAEHCGSIAVRGLEYDECAGKQSRYDREDDCYLSHKLF